MHVPKGQGPRRRVVGRDGRQVLLQLLENAGGDVADVGRSVAERLGRKSLRILSKLEGKLFITMEGFFPNFERRFEQCLSNVDVLFR